MRGKRRFLWLCWLRQSMFFPPKRGSKKKRPLPHFVLVEVVPPASITLKTGYREHPIRNYRFLNGGQLRWQNCPTMPNRRKVRKNNENPCS
jgi:hypothetical protein